MVCTYAAFFQSALPNHNPFMHAVVHQRAAAAMQGTARPNWGQFGVQCLAQGHVELGFQPLTPWSWTTRSTAGSSLVAIYRLCGSSVEMRGEMNHCGDVIVDTGSIHWTLFAKPVDQRWCNLCGHRSVQGHWSLFFFGSHIPDDALLPAPADTLFLEMKNAPKSQLPLTFSLFISPD